MARSVCREPETDREACARKLARSELRRTWLSRSSAGVGVSRSAGGRGVGHMKSGGSSPLIGVHPAAACITRMPDCLGSTERGLLRT